MPTYEYRCEDCGEAFEQRETIAETSDGETEVLEVRKREDREGVFRLLLQDIQEKLNGRSGCPVADGKLGIGKATVLRRFPIAAISYGNSWQAFCQSRVAVDWVQSERLGVPLVETAHERASIVALILSISARSFRRSPIASAL